MFAVPLLDINNRGEVEDMTIRGRVHKVRVDGGYVYADAREVLT